MKSQKPLLFIISLLNVTLGHLNICASESTSAAEAIWVSFSPSGFAKIISYVVQSGHTAELREEFFTSFKAGNSEPVIQLLEAYLYALQNPNILLYPQKLESQNLMPIISLIHFMINSLKKEQLTPEHAHIQAVISALDTADTFLKGLSEDAPQPLKLP